MTQYLSTMPWREQLKTYREIYRERRDALLSALSDLMPAGTTWTHPAGGLFVWATLPDGPRLEGDDAAGDRRPGRVRAGHRLLRRRHRRGNMRLNFSFPPPDRMREGVRRLAGVMEQELAMRQVFGAISAAARAPRGQAGADAPGPDLA